MCFFVVIDLTENLSQKQSLSIRVLLCAATWPSVLVCDTMERLDADLCYMNQLVMWNFICCTMAHNENRRGAYGMSMRIIDMAGTVDLLKEADGKTTNQHL